MSGPSDISSSADVIYKQKPSWFKSLGSFIFIAVDILMALFLLIFAMKDNQMFFGYALIALFLFFCAVLVLIIQIWRHYRTEYVITKFGIEIRVGILSRSAKTIPYDKITGVQINKSILNRILKIGSVYIETAGTFGVGRVGVQCIDDPEK